MSNNILFSNVISQFGGCEICEALFHKHYAATGDWRKAERIAQAYHDLDKTVTALLNMACHVHAERLPAGDMRKVHEDLHSYIMKRALIWGREQARPSRQSALEDMGQTRLPGSRSADAETLT